MPITNIMQVLRNVKAVKYSGWLPIEVAADKRQGSVGDNKGKLCIGSEVKGSCSTCILSRAAGGHGYSSFIY